MALALATAWPCAAEQTPQPSTSVLTASTAAAAVRQESIRAAERTWWLASDGVGTRAPGLEALVALPGWQWVGEQHSCPPALAIGPRGEALVTSNVVPSVWRIDPDTLAVSLHELELDSDQDKDVGFSSLRYSSDAGVWLAFSAAHGSTWQIDSTLTRATKVAHNPEWRMTCATN